MSSDVPHRPRTAFLLFSVDRREAVKREQPDLGFGDVAREVSRQWKESDAPTKEKYIRLFNDDKQRYEEEMAAYRKAHPPDKHRKRNHSSDDDEEDEEDEVEEDAETRPATQAVMSHPQLASTVNSLQETVEQLQRSMAEQQQQIAELTRRLDASQPHVSTSQ